MAEPYYVGGWEYLPCPFCGSLPDIRDGKYGEHEITCGKVKCPIGDVVIRDHNISVAVKQWNQRGGCSYAHHESCVDAMQKLVDAHDSRDRKALQRALNGIRILIGETRGKPT